MSNRKVQDSKTAFWFSEEITKWHGASKSTEKKRESDKLYRQTERSKGRAANL